METPRSLPTLQDVYDAYHWNSEPCADANVASTWEVPPTFGEELKEVMVAVSKKYSPRSLPTLNYQGTENPPPDVQSDKLELLEGSMTCEPSVTYRVFEEYGYGCVDDQANKKWALWLELKRENELLCACFLQHANDGSWNFSHRVVPAAYRGKKLFSHFSAAMETFVYEWSKRENSRQTIYLHAGQPDVVLAFLKRGYAPPDEANQRKMEQMLHPDSNMELHYALRPNWSAGGNAHRPAAPELSSPYCFEKKKIGNDPELRTQGNALRVKLQQEFKGNAIVDQQLRNETNAKIRSIL